MKGEISKIQLKLTALYVKFPFFSNFTRKMLICAFTGFNSGLPLFVLSQMLPVWLTDKHLSIELIGAVTGVMLPYGLKFFVGTIIRSLFPEFF